MRADYFIHFSKVDFVYDVNFDNRLEVCYKPRIGKYLHLLLRHCSADQIKDFGSNFLLAAFVVGEGELGDEVLGIV